MSENSFFFTAVSGAPAYSADDIVKWLYDRLFHGEGVLKGLYNGLAVSSDGAGNALIATGSATKSGHGYYNDSSLTKALTPPATGYTNINTIVIRVDSSVSPNTMHAIVLVGSSVAIGNTPTAPSIALGSDVYLADIQVTNTSGTYSYIVTDKRVYVPIISNGLLGANWESELEKAIGAGLLAPLASPTFTGTPAAPTPSVGTNTTQIATAAMVTAAVAAEASTRSGADSTLQTNITAAVAAEASARIAADNIIRDPIGTVKMFSGVFVNNVTAVGWYVCDGTNGTPNLVDKFIMGGSSSGGTGGANTHSNTVSEMAPHTHSPVFTSGEYPVMSNTNINTSPSAHASTTVVDFATGAGHMYQGTFSIADNGSGESWDCRPSYYTLIFIIRMA